MRHKYWKNVFYWNDYNFQYCLSVVCYTLPVPSGIFLPSFVIGAAMGRLIGEVVAYWYPEGFRGEADVQVYPGIYAIVGMCDFALTYISRNFLLQALFRFTWILGAAAFTGAVTHAVSVSVIVFEMTGQITFLLPVLVSIQQACEVESGYIKMDPNHSFKFDHWGYNTKKEPILYWRGISDHIPSVSTSYYDHLSFRLLFFSQMLFAHIYSLLFTTVLSKSNVCPICQKFLHLDRGNFGLHLLKLCLHSLLTF